MTRTDLKIQTPLLAARQTLSQLPSAYEFLGQGSVRLPVQDVMLRIQGASFKSLISDRGCQGILGS